MDIKNEFSDKNVLVELGESLTQLRIQQNMTQFNLAKRAGIGKRTLEHLENGDSVQITTFIRVLRALSVLQNLNYLLPDKIVSPMELLNKQKKSKKRGSSVEYVLTHNPPWKWGDE